MQKSNIAIASAVAAAQSGSMAQLEQAHQRLMADYIVLQGRVQALAAERDELGAKLLSAAQRETLLSQELEEIARTQHFESNDEEYERLREIIDSAKTVLDKTCPGWSAGINIAGG